MQAVPSSAELISLIKNDQREKGLFFYSFEYI